MIRVSHKTSAPKGETGKRRMGAAGWMVQRLWLLLPVLAIPALWTFLARGLTQSADGQLHLFRLTLLDQHLRQGVLYPRWIPELVLGYGYPVFSFYAPASYYWAELWHLLGMSYEAALMMALGTFVVLGGYGAYLLALEVFGSHRRWVALVVATTYMYAPYLLTNVFIRGAIAEVGAQVLLPWIFWSTLRLTRTDHPAPHILAVAFSLGGLAVTHNITLIFMSFVWLAFALLAWWQAGRGGRLLLRLALAGAAALGVSAFFWGPLVLERQFLSEVAYKVSATYLPENLWTGHNFLDTGITFDHTFSVPYRLGLLQIILAALGLGLARRRDVLWLFFVAMAAMAGLGVAQCSESLWLHSKTLLIAQFPWRLLSFMGVTLALLTGGIFTRMRAGFREAAAAVLALGLIIFAQTPRLGWLRTIPHNTATNSLPALAQFESETGALGTSSAQEFRPRWAGNSQLTQPSEMSSGAADVRLRTAGSFGLVAEVMDADGGPLRFTNFYFPGWRVVLDGKEPLRTYPSTNLGMLTIDLPAGRHQLVLSWQGTTIQKLASMISLITLAGLTWLVARPGSRRTLAIIPLAFLVWGLVATFNPPRLSPVTTPEKSVTVQDVTFIGYRQERSDPRHLVVFPYWYVQSTPSDDFEVTWQLLDTAGHVVSQVTAKPYFNSGSASDWPARTLVDDAHILPIPPGIPAGIYRLALQVRLGSSGSGALTSVVGDVKLDALAPQRPPVFPLVARFDDSLLLAGYDLHVDKYLSVENWPRVPIVRAGERLKYTLYWQTEEPLEVNYHSFLHMVDRLGQPLVQEDHIPGAWANTPKLWDIGYLQPDQYLIQIPPNARSGLYFPAVGMYEFKTQKRLQQRGPDGTVAYEYRLPPVKVLGQAPKRPSKIVYARFADIAVLLGYDLTYASAGVHPGDQITLSLHFRSEVSTDKDYIRFVHLYSPELGMAAQQDGPPVAGHNPTWAWVPGEEIADQIVLKISEDAKPGRYLLQIGLYEVAKPEKRLSGTDRQGHRLPDDQVMVTPVDVIP